ncbi:succinate dehydrogenase assembly factor 2 [Pseudoruegeria sp. SHC-113]|uniref:FAD assembly factor SdhE n=1 Tax=Pseudoruegeria sp. SHC-113 TaxID=2855439 RepID=UPI0021BAAC2D|nr:succinate dehydrogenase assembly factor 2 [Pseudoruegeria sp. SHC-113]MCT8161059.1 succinate dehydrogenase assembly factor 2 [Pseudoruegeria sp. SHC-113]
MGVVQETPDARLKRMTMRSWRRGMKEMDVILGPFADSRLAALGEAELLLYDRLLAENDQDLLSWVTGQAPTPPEYLDLLTVIARHARGEG